MAGPDFSRFNKTGGPDFSKFVRKQPQSSVVGDILRSGASGLRAGYEGLAGLGGDVYNLEVTLAEKLASLFGASPERLAEIRANRGKNWLPTSQDISKDTSQFIGEPYQPQTEAGKWAHTGGAFLTNPSKNILRSVVAPTIGTEVGGKVGEAYGDESLGRLLGGLGGAVVPGATTRLVAGPKVDPVRASQIKTLADEGVDLTAGQATGRKALQYTEAGPFEGKAAGLADTQASQFSSAALKRAGIAADRATPDVMAKAYDDFGAQYDDLIARSGGAPLDNPLQTELLQTVDDFHRLKGLPSNAPTAVNAYFKRISDAAQAGGGVIPADTFKTIRSDIARDLRNSKDPETIQSLRQLNDSMFDSIGRNGPPDIVAQWKDVNNRYRNYKVIEKAMGGAGEATALGFISPSKLRTATEQGDRGGYVRGRGDYADLARAGETTMKPLPQSGTAGRTIPFGTMLLAGERLLSGDLKGAGIAAGATALPAAASSLLTSRPVRTSLIRQATEPLPLLDPMTAALLMRQKERR